MIKISSKMEALAALRLSLSPRRYRPNSDKYCEDESALSSPYYLSAPSSPYYLSAPTSPRPSALREVEETPLGEVLAAIPFDWEFKPGTPKRRNREYGDLIEGEDPEPPSPMRLSRESSISEFDFSSTRFLAVEDTTHGLTNDGPVASADQLFLHGQLLPLRLPPRLQAVKHLGESDETSIHGSFRRPVSPRPGISTTKLMSFQGTSKSPQREVRNEDVELRPKNAKLQKFRSLSPLRIFKRENSEVSIFFSEKSTSGSESASSSSSAFSSSSSGDEKSNIRLKTDSWPSFKEEDECKSRSTLNDFLYSDKPPASPKIDVSKLSSKEVLYKADGLKASEKGLKSVPSKELKAAKQENAPERKVLIPQLSRSNARSISRTPLVVSPVTAKNKERLLSSNPLRFGFLKQCIGGF